MRCIWCGKVIKRGRQYCCLECRMADHKEKMEKAKPPKHTHCLNPACGKELDHWSIPPSRKTRMYTQNKECCDMTCQAAYKSHKMKGAKGNLESTGSSKRKYIPMNFSKVEVIHDPLVMIDSPIE